MARGEELVSEVEAFCAKDGISAAWVEGLGACDLVEVSYYDLKVREYIRQSFTGEFELLNLCGNIAMKEQKPFLHAHAMLSRTDHSAFGGHLHRMRISGTGEVMFRKLGARIARAQDQETGLWLLEP